MNPADIIEIFHQKAYPGENDNCEGR